MSENQQIEYFQLKLKNLKRSTIIVGLLVLVLFIVCIISYFIYQELYNKWYNALIGTGDEEIYEDDMDSWYNVFLFSLIPTIIIFVIFLIIITRYYKVKKEHDTLKYDFKDKKEKKRERRLDLRRGVTKYPSQQVPSYQSGPSSVGFTVDKKLSKKDNLLIFASYATKDADLFKISDIATALTSYNEINDVLYWQEDVGTSIVEYMEQNLNKCDILLLFCSPNSLNSAAVKKEYEAAQFMGKIIIPVFSEISHVPTLLQPALGVKFDMFNLQKTIGEIYNVIRKKM